MNLKTLAAFLALSLLPAGCAIESAEPESSAGIPEYEEQIPVDDFRPEAPGPRALEIGDWVFSVEKLGDFEYAVSRPLATVLAGPNLIGAIDGQWVRDLLADDPLIKGHRPDGLLVIKALPELELFRGDVIQEINGVVIEQDSDLRQALDNMDDMVVLSLARNHEPFTYIYRIR